MLYFYTVITNLLCIVTALTLLILQFSHKHIIVGNRQVLTVYKFVLCVSILIVMFIFHFILKPNSNLYQNMNHIQIVYDYCLHYIVPVFFVLDWALVDNKDHILWTIPLWALIYPLVYIIFVYIRAIVGN